MASDLFVLTETLLPAAICRLATAGLLSTVTALDPSVTQTFVPEPLGEDPPVQFPPTLQFPAPPSDQLTAEDRLHESAAAGEAANASRPTDSASGETERRHRRVCRRVTAL